jgi:2-polyprenyl-3-methyl-5-hydroxy-6-metoxy-1,4-benzoquinol methylase
MYSYTASEAAAHFCPVTRDRERFLRLEHSIDRLWQGSDCRIYRCRDCGFGFGFPFVGGDEEFYGILHEQRGYPDWRWDYDVALTHALSRCAGGKILDVGAGVGKFLRRLGPEWERYAVETSDLNRKDLNAAGIHVFRDLTEAAKTERGTFQVITLFQVLEHISEFGLTIANCHELLSPGGRLVVTVPDCDAMIRQERVTGCHDMPPNHVNKWTPESLTRVLRRSGFECSKPIYEPASWRNLKANLHLRVGADAAEPKSLAAQAYRIRNRPLRIAALSLLGGPALLRMLPYGRQLKLGGAFAMVGVAGQHHPAKS